MSSGDVLIAMAGVLKPVAIHIVLVYQNFNAYCVTRLNKVFFWRNNHFAVNKHVYGIFIFKLSEFCFISATKLDKGSSLRFSFRVINVA